MEIQASAQRNESGLNVHKEWDEAVDAAAAAWSAGPVLIHCAMGLQRSVLVACAVLVELQTNGQPGNALERLEAALQNGDSLLLFPEGTRSRGSDLLPGHGGMLDRVDSPLLSAPVYYRLVRLLLDTTP